MMQNKIIAALDFDSADQVESFLNDAPSVKYVKVGPELFYSEGPAIIKMLKKRGLSVFLDFKLYDVPNTVNRTVTILADLGVDMLSIHTSGGVEMMQAANKAAREAIRPIRLIGVPPIDCKRTLELQIGNALEAGLSGVMGSIGENKMIRNRFGSGLTIVTPGIKLLHLVNQIGIGTPKQAFDSGADFIVIGRTLSWSQTPERVFQDILAELNEK